MFNGEGEKKDWQRSPRDGKHHADKRQVSAFVWKEIKAEAVKTAKLTGVCLSDHLDRSLRLGNLVFRIPELEKKCQEERTTPEELVTTILKAILK